MRRPWTSSLLAALGTLVAVWAALPAQAQTDAGGVGGDLELRVARFGPGGVCRQGEWVGVLVEVADRGLEQRDLILRIEGEDPDGDRPVYDRAITSNPGSAQSFWLYTRLGWEFDQGTPITISAWPKSGEDRDREGALAFEPGNRPLARLGATTSGVLDKSQGMIGVLGQSTFGLRGYDLSRRGSIGDNHITGHELSRVVGMDLADIPDRPQGLMQFDVLVWGGARSPDPLRLSPEQTRALRGWIEWGGRLVVVLPSVGQEWLARSNPLFDLLPDALPGEQAGGVDLDPYRYLLTKRADIVLPTDASVRFLDPNPDAAPSDATPIIASPDGRAVVVSRTHAGGAVTLVGLDLADPKLSAISLPEADQFWNRVLGRRVDLDETSQVWRKAQGSQRTPLSFDTDIPGEIAKSGRAYVGVLLGIVVFALYWVIAGPGGFAALSKLKQKRHAWVAFVAAVGVFTAIAWTGATAIRPRRVEAVQLTFLHQVHGQSLQRARTWASVLLPSYGEGTIGVGSGNDTASSWRVALISPWSPPVTEVFKASSFPDNREYRVDGRRPDSMRVPTRSTVKQVRADWVGEARWSMPVPVAAAGEVGDARLWIDEGGRVHGLLEHDLPADVQDLVVVVVQRPRIVSGRMGPSAPFLSYSFKWKDPWAPGRRLNLYEDVSRAGTLSDAAFDKYAEILLRAGKPIISDFGRADSGSAMTRYYGLELFPMLLAPNFEQSGAGDRLARRSETHGLDLGQWFTRPCVILLGWVENPRGAEGPVPLTVNGRPAPVSGGRTLISWVYPLPANPAAPSAPDDATPTDEVTDDG